MSGDNDFNPELGQALFGQPTQSLECPADLEEVIQSIGIMLDVVADLRPCSNNGDRYDGTTFSMHAYSWDDEEEQEFNFKWRDFKASWYKYIGRSMTVNRLLKREEVVEMLKECTAEIFTMEIVPDEKRKGW